MSELRRQEIELRTADGLMNTFVVRPAHGGPHPVVLFLMDARGRREELDGMAARVADAGYLVVLPNLYYRHLRQVDPALQRAITPEQVQALTSTLDVDKVAADTRAVLEHVDADPDADGSRVGIVGYCMGGRYAYAMAGVFGDRILAAASIYGVRLSGPGSPDELAPSVTGELYFACASEDELAPAEMVDGLRARLAEVGARATIEWYPGVTHGFAFPQRESYDEPAAERHYERILDLFARTLGP